jgi:hypothetical protein
VVALAILDQAVVPLVFQEVPQSPALENAKQSLIRSCDRRNGQTWHSVKLLTTVEE